MSLQGRIQSPTANQDNVIPVHVFTAACNLWLRGEVTDQNMQSVFNFDATEQSQMQQIKTAYNAATATGKIAMLMNLEAAGVMYEQGYINAAKYASLVGVT